jgi:hypothetical protein
MVIVRHETSETRYSEGSQQSTGKVFARAIEGTYVQVQLLPRLSNAAQAGDRHALTTRHPCVNGKQRQSL